MITATCEPDESTVKTAARELYEETKLKPVKFYVVPYVNTFYFDLYDSICLSPVFLPAKNLPRFNKIIFFMLITNSYFSISL